MAEKNTDRLTSLSSAHPESSLSSKAHFGTWGIYAAAAGATLAMSTNAQAVIIYTTLGQTVTQPVGAVTSMGHSISSKNLPISILGKKPLESIYLRKNSSLVPGIGQARLFGDIPLATAGGLTSAGGRAAKDFVMNAAIGASQNFPGGGGTFLEKHTSSGPLKGAFGGQKTGFVGFEYDGVYGWIEVMLSDAGSPGYANEFKAIAYAYNTVAGATIDAGQGIPTSTPEPDTAALGLLAAGAAGLAVWRRRRKEAAAV